MYSLTLHYEREGGERERGEREVSREMHIHVYIYKYPILLIGIPHVLNLLHCTGRSRELLRTPHLTADKSGTGGQRNTTPQPPQLLA